MIVSMVFCISACNKNGPIPDPTDTTPIQTTTTIPDETSSETSESASDTSATSQTTATTTSEETTASSTEQQPAVINYLTGLPLEEGEDGTHRPTLVVINNIRASLPQSGLENADIIFEVEAEAGITRLLAVFYDPTDVEKIGTVRSTRSAFVNIALGLDAVMFHAGGSPQAYTDISTYLLPHVDYDAITYYYDQNRLNSGYSLEHTLYTTGARLSNAWRSLEASGTRTTIESAYASPFTFYEEDTTPIDGFIGGKIVIKYSSANQPFFRYDEVSGTYLRWEYGNYHIDENTGNQLAFKNVIALSVTSTVIDSAGRRQFDDIGTGGGYYLTNGVAIRIKWSKESATAPLVLTYEDGTPLVINTGKTFIAYANGFSNIIISE